MNSSEPAPVPSTPARPILGRSLAAIVVGILVLLPFVWILARVVWLPFYFGLFFFLIGGLLIGSVAFRMARPVRPLDRSTIVAVIFSISFAALILGLWCEFEHVAATIGDPPHFADARAASQARGEPSTSVGLAATRAFRRFIQQDFAPGGAVGYAHWAIAAGRVKLALPDGSIDIVGITQRRWAWLLRTIAAYALLAVGLASQLLSLRSATATTNFLLPGEEAEDDAESS